MKAVVAKDCCRVCLTKSRKLRSLYKAVDEGDEPPYEMLLRITGIEVEKVDTHTMLPKNICKKCEMSLSMAFEFREKALESHEAILTYMRELKIPFKQETDNPPVTPSSSPITLTSPPPLTVKPEYGNLIMNQDLEHVLENKLPTEDGIEILNSMSNHDTQNQNTIELQLDELIIPVKGEELPQENDEYTKTNIANSSPEHTYEEIQEVDDEDEEDICGEDTNNEQQQYDDGMEKLSLIEEGEDDEDGVQHHNLEDHDDEHIIGVEAHNERMSLIETTSGTKAWNQQVNENKIQIDLQYDGSSLESKPTSRRSRSTKDAMDFLGYVCDICGNVFSKRSRMMEHRQRHERELKYTCELCDKKFHMRELLRKHMYSHSGGKPLKCQYCSRTFYYESVRKAHEAVHKGLKPYVCDVCGKAFSYGHSLKKHKLIHAELKLYRCEYCKKDFRLQHHMKQHELTKAHQKAVQIARGSLMSTHNDADEVFTHDILEDEDILEDRIANVS